MNITKPHGHSANTGSSRKYIPTNSRTLPWNNFFQIIILVITGSERQEVGRRETLPTQRIREERVY